MAKRLTNAKRILLGILDFMGFMVFAGAIPTGLATLFLLWLIGIAERLDLPPSIDGSLDTGLAMAVNIGVFVGYSIGIAAGHITIRLYFRLFRPRPSQPAAS